MEMQPYTWKILSTITGATAATLLVVQYSKDLVDRVIHVPTRILTLVVALLILLGAQAFTVGLSLASVPLVVLNAFTVALAAVGAFETSGIRKSVRDAAPPSDRPDPPH